MYRRLSKLRNILNEKELDGVWIVKKENKRYVSGFTGTSGYALITKNNAFFITDFRYIEQAKQQCQGYEILEHNQNRSIYSIIEDLHLKTLGFEEDFITYGEYITLTQNLKDIHFVPLEGALDNLRKIKDAEEIQCIEKAAMIADEGFGYICEYIKPGVTEKEIALELENYMKRKGATSTSFETIVASGVRSALPHGVASDKCVEIGDFITMDFGCIYKGYCSDMTRTIVLGKANNKQKEIYNIVLQAQQKALEMIKPGMKCTDVDQVARDLIDSKGYGKHFGHGLGHGVGLEIHEQPRLSPTGYDTLQEGMIVTDEPGIYLPGFGGVRIEDLVVVTKDFNRVLSKSPKRLIEL